MINPARAFLFFILMIFLCISVYSQDPGKPVIAVMDFTASGVSEQEMKMVISLISSTLYQSELFKVIDIGQRDTLLDELEFSLSGCTDEACALEVGQMLAAELLVVGQLGRLGQRYAITLKLMNVENGETEGTADGVYVTFDEMVDGLGPLSGILVKKYGGSKVFGTGTTKMAGPKKRVSPMAIVSLSAGSALVLAGGFFVVSAFLQSEEVDNLYEAYQLASEADKDERYAEYEDAYTTRMWSLIGGGSGAVLGIGAIIFAIATWNHQPKQKGPSVQAKVTPTSLGLRISY
ncbi:MAG: hypothetical protein JW874_00925 [Spirochaetales bacterium]|nr:hypothetical protein [Spirochaetales bacterium]